MRVAILLVWLCFCIWLVGYVSVRKGLSKYGVMLLCLLSLFLYVGGSKVFNLYMLPTDVKQKVDKVVDVCGDTYISTKGSKIYILVKNRWLDIEKVKILGSLLSEDITIEYEGEKIYLGKSGVANTIRTMESVGILKK